MLPGEQLVNDDVACRTDPRADEVVRINVANNEPGRRLSESFAIVLEVSDQLLASSVGLIFIGLGKLLGIKSDKYSEVSRA